MAADLAKLAGDLVRDESERQIALIEKEGGKARVHLVGLGLAATCAVSEFGGVGKVELINDRFQEFPEPLVHADGLDDAVDGAREAEEELLDLVDALAGKGASLEQFAGLIPDGEGERDLMEVNADK
jgi:hypothetical protein